MDRWQILSGTLHLSWRLGELQNDDSCSETGSGPLTPGRERCRTLSCSLFLSSSSATNWRYQSDGSRSASGTDNKERWHQRNMAQMALTPRKDGWNSKTHLLSTQQRRTIDDIFIWDMSVLRCFTQFKSSNESSICKVGTQCQSCNGHIWGLCCSVHCL